ncbi:MAG TPA: NBR1-Ig-like domain-containing protein, partial [Rhodopila sp.]
PFRFRMLSPTHGTFGEETPDPMVTLTTAAEFVSQQVPATMEAGGSVAVSVTFKNTTSVTWTAADGYSLVPAGPSGNTLWGISTVALPAPVAPGESVTFSFTVIAPSALGTYNFQWQMNLQSSGPFGQISPATAVQVIAAGPPNFEGLWWNAPAGSEAGWGINLAHQADIIFATWFTYDLTGKGLWLTLTAPRTATNTYSGTLIKATGPAFDAVPFNPAQVVGTSVGSGTLTFTDINNGTFAYTVNGISQTKTITRQVFGPLPTCRFGALANLTLATNFQDLWWNSPPQSEAGWGINLTHQGTRIFATWFTYDHDRTPMWLVATMLNTAPATYVGTLYRTTGPPFNAVPFNAANVVGTTVGTATLTFADGATAAFSYTVNGVSQTKPITREVFAAPGTVCQ